MGVLDRLLRRRARIVIDGRPLVVVPGSGVSVHETEGRIILRVVDGWGGLGIERDENHVFDGYPDVDADRLGTMITEMLFEAREADRPERRRPISEYAAPLIAASPGRFRSHRAWQRATRYVSVSTGAGLACHRFHADLGRGAWEAVSPDDVRCAGYPQDVDLGSATTSADLGAAVLQLLEQPPIAG